MVIGTYRPIDAWRPEHPLRAIESDKWIHHYVMSSFWSRCGQSR
jgi:hypothetical protein